MFDVLFSWVLSSFVHEFHGYVNPPHLQRLVLLECSALLHKSFLDRQVKIKLGTVTTYIMRESENKGRLGKSAREYTNKTRKRRPPKHAYTHDSVNVGNARLYKLETDLHLSSSQFQLVIALFYLSYMLGVPFNLVLKLVTPRRLIAAITVSWGLVATLMGLVDSYASLVACRVLLGAVEAGLFPGFNLYLTFFYTKHELALRVGYLFVSAAIAGALGGLLAYAIGQMDGVAGLSGWRWIFILEGIPSVLLGVLTYFALPNDAPTAWFLTDQEKALMELRRRRAYGNTASSDRLSREDVKRAVTDWRMWAFYVAQFAIDTMLFGTLLSAPLSNFLSAYTPLVLASAMSSRPF